MEERKEETAQNSSEIQVNLMGGECLES